MALVAVCVSGVGCCGPTAQQRALIRDQTVQLEHAERAFDSDRWSGPDGALAQFEAIAGDPGMPSEARARSRRRQAHILREQGRIEAARSLYAAVAELGVPEESARAADAAAGTLDERSARRAQRWALIERYPGTATAERVLEALVVGARAGECAAALPRLARIHTTHAERALGPTAALATAECALRVGDLPTARATLRQITARWPGDPATAEALWSLGGLYRRQGAWDRAIATYLALADWFPDRGWPAMGSARHPKVDDAALWAARCALDGAGAPDRAEVLATEALETFDDTRVTDELRWVRARARFAAGGLEAARGDLEMLARARPPGKRASAAQAVLDGRPAPAPDPTRVAFDDAPPSLLGGG